MKRELFSGENQVSLNEIHAKQFNMGMDSAFLFVYTRKSQLKSLVVVDIKINHDVRAGTHDLNKRFTTINAIIITESIYLS